MVCWPVFLLKELPVSSFSKNNSQDCHGFDHQCFLCPLFALATNITVLPIFNSPAVLGPCLASSVCQGTPAVVYLLSRTAPHPWSESLISPTTRRGGRQDPQGFHCTLHGFTTAVLGASGCWDEWQCDWVQLLHEGPLKCGIYPVSIWMAATAQCY